MATERMRRALGLTLLLLLVANAPLVALRLPAVDKQGVVLAAAPEPGGLTVSAPVPVPAAVPTDSAGSAPAPTPTPAASPTPTPIPTPMHTPSPTAAPAPVPTPTPVALAAPQRAVIDTGYLPFATVAGIDLSHPARFVEAIGFHQSNHEGAQDMTVYDTAARPMVLESRDRLTGFLSAADVVVDPAAEIRAPVTGTVKRGGTYVLYCDHDDEFLVIAPDANPAWEVKILHVTGLTVQAGDRVEAGVTVIAQHATLLPFGSQVDDFTAEPHWPHNHIEVVDPSIPNRPNEGSGAEDC